MRGIGWKQLRLLVVFVMLGALFASSALSAGGEDPNAPTGPIAPQAGEPDDPDSVDAANIWAVVNSAGTLIRGASVVSAAHLGAAGSGAYEVIFSKNVQNCAFVASVGDTGAGVAPTGSASTANRGSNPANGVFIKTYDTAGAGADRPFHLQVICGAKKVWAVVDDTSTEVRSGRAGVANDLGTGSSEVIFNKSVTKCAYTASIGNPAFNTPPAGRISTARRAGNANGIFIDTEDSAGAQADLPYHVAAICGGRKLWSVVSGAGALARGGNVVSVARLAAGRYEVIFNQVVSGCSYVATIGTVSTGTETSGFISTASRAGNTSGVFILTEDAAGTDVDRGFHLSVLC